LSGSELAVGHNLDSCTADVQVSRPFELDQKQIRLVATPGFDDSMKSDAEILTQIADFLNFQYKRGHVLHGVLYLHRISDGRIGGAARRNIVMFHKLCGSDAFTNVVIATTRWDGVTEEIGTAREQELREKSALFQPALDGGAHLLRHDRGLKSAQNIVRHFLHLPPKALSIQTEMVDGGKLLSETEAGSELQRDIILQLEKQKEKLAEVIQEQTEAAEEHDEELNAEVEEEIRSLHALHTRLRDQYQKLADHQGLPVRLSTGDVDGAVPDAITQSTIGVPSVIAAQGNTLPPESPIFTRDITGPTPVSDVLDTHGRSIVGPDEVSLRLTSLERSVEGVQSMLKGMESRVQCVEEHLRPKQPPTPDGPGPWPAWTGWLYRQSGQWDTRKGSNVAGIVPSVFRSGTSPSTDTEDYVMLDASDSV